jgi:hypothetical protein
MGMCCYVQGRRVEELRAPCRYFKNCYAGAMSFPLFSDLEALAASLRDNGKHAAIKQILKQAWRAESCLGDLKQAKDCCDVLRDGLNRLPKDYTLALHTIERSLLATAILLYSRGTSTGSGKAGERGSIQLERGQLSKEQWQDHQTLLDVRNQSLAHVNPSHAVGARSWHRVMLFAVRYPNGGWRPASATNETGFHKETYERLERMLPVAREIVLKQFRKRMAAVSKLMNEAYIAEQTFIDHLFDPVVFFGDESAVRRILEGSSNETDGFWIND